MKELEKKLKEIISEKRGLGEQAGGSGHLGFRSITKESKDVKEITHEGKTAYEVIIEYEIYTETEFMHSPEDDMYYTSKYKDRIILDENLNLLLHEDIK